MAKRKVKYNICPNCDYSFKDVDNYCPNCGQKNHTHKLPIHHFLFELIEGYFHLDSKIINTLRDMFIKPGLVTRNYNRGKRAMYISPVKFYIFVSFIFFLILSIHKVDNNSNSTQSGNGNGWHLSLKSIDSVAKQQDLDKLSKLGKLDNALIDHYLDSINIKPEWYLQFFYRNWVKLRTGHITPEDYRHQTLRTFSTAMFFLMPLVAFYLLLFHRKLKMYYSEHLVFSIHIHSLAFLLLSIWLILKPFLSSGWLLLVFLSSILIYIVLSLKTAYQQTLGIAIIKSIFLGLLYVVTFIVFFFLILIISLH